MGQERGLQIDEHPTFSHRLWGVQRGAVPVLVLLVVLALLGAFGYGWLAKGQVGEEGEPLWLTYDSLAQIQTPTVLTAHVARIEGDELELWVDSKFLEAAHIDRIQPEPAESTFDNGRIRYRFSAQEGVGEAAVYFRYTPTKAGTIESRIGIIGGQERTFSVFVYP